MKWAFALIGYFIFRFPGAIIGFLIGSVFENTSVKTYTQTSFGRQTVSPSDFELNLRTALSYFIAKYFTSNDSQYLLRENFRSGKLSTYRGKQEYEIDQLLRKLNKIKNDNVQPMKHYRRKYGNVPPWILIKGTTFGNLIKLYNLQKGNIKTEVISLMLGIPTELISNNEELKNLFGDLLRLFLKYRNRSAHGGRIYNYVPEKTKIRYSSFFHEKMNINQAEYRTGQGQYGIRVLLGGLSLFKNQEAFKHLYSVLSNESKSLNKKYPGFMETLSDQMKMDLSILIEVDHQDGKY